MDTPLITNGEINDDALNELLTEYEQKIAELVTELNAKLAPADLILDRLIGDSEGWVEIEVGEL